IELVHAQFRRGSDRNDVLDLELYENLSSLCNQIDEVAIDPALLNTLRKKLQLMCVEDLKQESLALRELVVNSKGDMEKRREKTSKIPKKIQDFLEAGKPNVNGSSVSLELMKDPVIIFTGQTYERAYVKKWLEDGNITCPQTQQIISNTTLKPNYAFRSLIFSWCEANGVDFSGRSDNFCLDINSCYAERAEIDSLLTRLVSTDIEVQRVAAAPDNNTQEHAVTGLLNLSICQGNKRSIISSNCLPGIIDVLQNGRAIPALVVLLGEGSRRGKMDASTALFNLCMYQGNKDAKAEIGDLDAVPVSEELLASGSPSNRENATAVLVQLCAANQNYLLDVSKVDVSGPLSYLSENGTKRVKHKASLLFYLISRVHEQDEETQAHADSPPLDITQLLPESFIENGRQGQYKEFCFPSHLLLLDLD
ncbi:U-box domain, partial [Dillenia turbinata]